MNKETSGKPRLALIAGPTASGKSALALALAERASGTIINADAMQVYRDLPILSAQPSAHDQARVPHRLYAVRDPAEPWSAADWAEAAKAVVREVQQAGGLPILVGGSGMYIRTLLEGIAPVPPIDPAVRSQVRALPQEQARHALEREDAAAAARLHPADALRTARALEVVRATGRPLHLWQQERRGGIGHEVALEPLVLLPARPLLYRRCDDRLGAMVAAGALDEVRALLARALPASLPAMRTIGVPEFGAVLLGQWSLVDGMAAARQATRRYAKRQLTWLAHQLPPDWPRQADLST